MRTHTQHMSLLPWYQRKHPDGCNQYRPSGSFSLASERTRLLSDNVIEILLLVLFGGSKDDRTINSPLCLIKRGYVIIQIQTGESSRGMEDSCCLAPVVVVVCIKRPPERIKPVVYCKIPDVVIPLSGLLILLHSPEHRNILRWLFCDIVQPSHPYPEPESGRLWPFLT